MSLTLDQVEYIANLAKLELSDAEKDLYRQQLSTILDYVVRLQDLDTREILPTASILLQRSALRQDEVQPCLAREVLLRTAPHTDQEQFRIPPVFEQD